MEQSPVFIAPYSQRSFTPDTIPNMSRNEVHYLINLCAVLFKLADHRPVVHGVQRLTAGPSVISSI
jgi:hypothetical protein